MAGSNSKPNFVGQPTKPRTKGKWKYFFLNGNLHSSLFIDRANDEILTWCYPLRKRMTYTYSDSKKFREPAFTTLEVSKMIMRSRKVIQESIGLGNLTPPQYVYSLKPDGKISKYMWSEKNIMELHAWFSNVHRGRPRIDGLIHPQRLPSVRELRALIRQEEPLYVRDKDGVFQPVWQAKNFEQI